MVKISVCIATFNREKLLSFAIESVLNQTYQDFEIIVCDDGSTDNTPQLMAQYNDSRIRYIRHHQNIGKSNNMISGFMAAKGEYFIKFDDDDRLTPEFLAKTSEILDQDQTIDFVGTDHWIIDINNHRDQEQTKANSQFWGRNKLSSGIVDNLLKVVFVDQSFQIGATLFRMQTLKDVGYMLTNVQNCEDNDLFVRLALAEKKGYYLPELLMEYRVHDGQQGLNKARQFLRDQLDYFQRYTFPDEQIEKIRRSRILETQLILGLRLVEGGETEKGREMLWQSQSFSPVKAWTGLTLSLLPINLRKNIFNLLRKN